MTKIETELNLMILKLCEDLLPKTKVANDANILAAMKKTRRYLESSADTSDGI